MPDQSDVEQALAQEIAAILYPSGFESDSVTGDVFRIYRGWPVARSLDEDLVQGVTHVSVYQIAGTTRDTTRYPVEWQGSQSAASLTGQIVGETISFAGNGEAGQVIGVIVDGACYSYRTRLGDTPALVAAALAAQIRSDRPAVAVDAKIKLISARGLAVRIVTDGQGGRELRRQVGRFRATFWCPTPTVRDVAVALVDTVMADRTFLDIAGWACRLRLAGENSSDERSASGLWRRDLVYSVEYPTVSKETLPSMLFGIADVNSIPFVG